MKCFALLTVLGLIAGALFPGVGHTLVIPKDVNQLATEADQVLIGRVWNMRSDWTEDRSEIYTDVSLDVERTLKGRARDRVTFRVMGGTVGDETMIVPDSPDFEYADRVLVFLKTDDQGALRVWGWFQGKYIIRNDRAENDASETSVPLKDLIREIESALR